MRYRLEATCLSKEEPQIRTVLLQCVVREALELKALRSEDMADSDSVRVQADVVLMGQSDKVIEEVAARLSMEPGIRALSWEILDENGKNHRSLRRNSL